MSRGFSLAGLLRVREIQERAAAQRLSRAVIDAQHTEARDRALRAHLAATDAEAVDVRALAALAAARVSGRALLADLTALSGLQAEKVAEARTAHADARRTLRGLERLADKHTDAVRTADLQAEQAELDEIAVRSRTEGSA